MNCSSSAWGDGRERGRPAADAADCTPVFWSLEALAFSKRHRFLLKTKLTPAPRLNFSRPVGKLWFRPWWVKRHLFLLKPSGKRLKMESNGTFSSRKKKTWNRLGWNYAHGRLIYRIERREQLDMALLRYQRMQPLVSAVSDVQQIGCTRVLMTVNIMVGQETEHTKQWLTLAPYAIVLAKMESLIRETVQQCAFDMPLHPRHFQPPGLRAIFNRQVYAPYSTARFTPTMRAQVLYICSFNRCIVQWCTL